MARSSKSTPTKPQGAPAYAALLRGINVGGKNKLPMADLTAMFAEAGCAEVRSYIQSGNVVFSATAACAKRIPQLITDAIEKQFGFRTPVVLRTAEELAEIVARNPFLAGRKRGGGAAKAKTQNETELLHVVFLADLPEQHRIAALNPKRSPGDFFEARGREIYVQLPNGAGKTKLTNAYFDSTLATTSTMRNWRTVLKLAEMTQVAE